MLVVIMALAIVFTGAAVVMSDSGVDAAPWNMDGDIKADQEIAAKTDDVATGPFNVTDGATLKILEGGSFTIKEGVTVTIQKGSTFAVDKGAEIIVNGTLVIQNGAVLTNSTMADDTEGSETDGFVINGTMTVAKGATIDGTDGEITLGGKSTVTFGSTKTSPVTVSGQTFILNQGATLDFNAVAVEDIVVKTTEGKNEIGSSVTITGPATDGKLVNISFATESEKAGTLWLKNQTEAYDSKSTKYSFTILTVSGDVGEGNELTVTGTTAVDAQTDNDKNASGIAVCGIVKIAAGEELTVGEASKLTMDGTEVLEIDGKLTASGKAGTDTQATVELVGVVNIAGTVDVANVATTETKSVLTIGATTYLNIVKDGKVSVVNGALDSLKEVNIGGVYYLLEPSSSDDTLVITSLSNAVAETGADAITISGYEADGTTVLDTPYVIDSDLTISGKTITVVYMMKINEGVTLTIDETSEFGDVATTGVTTIDVDGILIDYSMYSEFKDNTVVDDGSFIMDADVRAVDSEETYYKYSSLKTALSTAVSGDVIELFGNATVTGNLTIPAEVTVKAGGKVLTVDNGSEVIINGILDLVLDVEDQDVSTDSYVVLKPAVPVEFKTAGKLTVNNIVVGAEDQILDAASSGNTVHVAGFYVTTADIGDYEAQPMVLAPAVAATNSANIDEAYVYAATTYSGDLSFATEEDELLIYVQANLTIGSITLKNYSIQISEEGVLTGTITTTSGSMDVAGIAAASGETIDITYAVDSETEAETLSISGAPQLVDKDGTINGVTPDVEAGSGELAVTPTANVSKVSITSGTIYVSEAFDVSNLKTFAVSSGATLEVRSTVTFSSLTIDGTVNVVGGGKLSGTAGYIEVLGTLTVKAPTAEDTTSGELDVMDVYVGMTKKEAVKTTGSSATFTATSGVSGILYVVNGATISEDMVEDKDSTAFYIEDVLWMTAYDMGGSTATVTNAPVENADFKGWNDAEGDPIYTSSSTTYATAITIADHDRVTAAVDYKIYTVTVLGDNGIGTVAIDGVVLYKESNKFVATGLTAGEHVLTYELKNGYTGTVSVAIDGTSLTDGKFTLSGTSTEDRNVEIIISGTVTGGTTSSGSSSDGMGLTDYLLIILVVLIVVMAIMVAMRLMRSLRL